MCGRFVLFSSLDDILIEFEIRQANIDWKPNYNVAPTQQVVTVVQQDGTNQLRKMVWGLVPSWAKDPAIGARLINARSESVHQKPTFKRSLGNRRCLVVADGFYEWRKEGKLKIPMFIRLKSGRPFGMAGLYDVWKNPEGDDLTSCTIITTEANDLVKAIHSRMPVILPPDRRAEWLDLSPKPVDELLSMLAPYPAHELEAYEVSRVVNSPQNNVIECIQPIGPVLSSDADSRNDVA